uniref:Uncharacterized protein n=1 Tax=Plectus sambesii TaxID=2011161 RepID=A0A914W917_9BILA
MRVFILLAIFVALVSGRSSQTQTSDRDAWGSSSRGGTDRDRESEVLPGNVKAIKVKGELTCGTAPATGVRVKLWGKETDLEPSVLLAHGVTDQRGTFSLEGDTQNKPTDFEFKPVLTIYHNCEYNDKDKLRRVLIKVPTSYVTTTRFASKEYNIGKMNLEPVYPKETHENVVKVDQLSLKRLLMKMFF